MLAIIASTSAIDIGAAAVAAAGAAGAAADGPAAAGAAAGGAPADGAAGAALGLDPKIAFMMLPKMLMLASSASRPSPVPPQTSVRFVTRARQSPVWSTRSDTRTRQGRTEKTWIPRTHIVAPVAPTRASPPFCHHAA